MKPNTWIKPELNWSPLRSDAFVCVASSVSCNDLVEVIADDGLTVHAQTKEGAAILYALGPNLHTAGSLLVSRGKGRGKIGQSFTFRLLDLVKVSNNEVAVVLGSQSFPSYGQRHPEHQSVAFDRMEQSNAGLERKRQLDDDAKVKMPAVYKIMMDVTGGHTLPDPPLFVELGLGLEEVGFVRELPKGVSRRARVVMDVVEASGRSESRTGRYDSAPILTPSGGEAAIVRWTARTSIPPGLELKAALERGFPSALMKSRILDQIPPEPIPTEVVTTPTSISDVDVEAYGDDLPSRLEESIAAMGSVRDAMQDLRGKLKERSLDAVGWYQPFHRFAEPVWGIHLHAPRLDCLAFDLAMRLGGSEPKPYQLAAHLAMQMVTAHEMFHAKMEFAGTWLEISSRRRRYLPYVKNVYTPARGKSDWTEEAIANWCARNWLEENLAALQSLGVLRDPGQAIRAVEDSLDFSPLGYNNWRVGFDDASWRQLSTELATSRAHPGGTAKLTLPLEGLLRSEALFDLRQGDIPVFFHGRGVIADVFFSAPSRREVTRLLSCQGYAVAPDRGKGSHEIWRGPGNREFTVPSRDPLSVGVFHELLGHFGWTKQQYIREIRLR